MNAFWNKNVKSFVMLLAFVFLLGTVCNNLVMHSYISRERRELYQSFSGIISEVLEAYPQVSEEKLIQSLTHRKGALDQDSILRQYGIFAQNEYQYKHLFEDFVFCLQQYCSFAYGSLVFYPVFGILDLQGKETFRAFEIHGSCQSRKLRFGA